MSSAEREVSAGQNAKNDSKVKKRKWDIWRNIPKTGRETDGGVLTKTSKSHRQGGGPSLSGEKVGIKREEKSRTCGGHDQQCEQVK